MDPFSITVGVIGLGDVTLRILTYLQHIKSASTKIQDEINALEQEISTLTIANGSVQEIWESKCDKNGNYDSGEQSPMVDSIWKNLGLIIRQAEGTVKQLEVLLKEVLGKKGALIPKKLESFMTIIRKEDRYSEYTQVRQRLTNYQAVIQMQFIALNTCV